MNRYWISWWQSDDQAFELHSPWWVSGYDAEDRRSICAAIIAESEDEARAKVIAAHDEPKPSEAALRFRFVRRQPDGWTPFSDRFRRAPWMRWPDAEPGGEVRP